VQKRDIIREIVTQRDILIKHREKINEITDMLKVGKFCDKKSLEVAYKLRMEQYVFKQIDTKFVQKYKFNDGKISVVSQLSAESAIVDGMSFTGHSVHSLRKCGDKATLVAVAQAEMQLSNSLQTLYDKTTEEIARLRNEYEKAGINDQGRKHNLVAEELKALRLLGRMKKGKHKAEMLVIAYIVERLDDLIVDKSVYINIQQQLEWKRKLSEMKVWNKLPDMMTERGGLGVAVGDGKLFAVGGHDGNDELKSGEYLNLNDVDTGWKKLPDMNIRRYCLGVAVGDGKLFAVGGSRDGIVHFKSGEWLRIAT